MTHAQAEAIPASTTCIWQYIARAHHHTAKFYNFAYRPHTHDRLHVRTDACRMRLWSYYTREQLCTGPVYDLDLVRLFGLNQPSSSFSSASITSSVHAPSGSASTSSMANNNNNANKSAHGSCSGASHNDNESGGPCWYPVAVQSAHDYYEQLVSITTMKLKRKKSK